MGTKAARWVLVPGTLCDGSVFDPLMAALDVPELQRLVLPQDLSNIEGWRTRLAGTVKPGDIVCGFSLGAIAVAHSADLLDEARALVLIALNPDADAPEKREGREGLRRAAKNGEIEHMFHAAAPALFARPTPALIEAVTRMAQAEARHIDAQTDLALSRPGALPALSRARLPVVFVTGADDKQAPPSLATEAALRTPRAALSVPHGLGHFCLLEDPACMATEIAKGLQELGVSSC